MIRERSAGGVVYRVCDKGVELLLIRDRYGRWTLPKGGIEAGETSEEAALREILEETGVTGKVKCGLGETRYWYTNTEGKSVNKLVQYYLVCAVTDAITPALGEIAGAMWVPLPEAVAIPGYSNNREVLERAATLLTKAEDRDLDWQEMGIPT